MKKVVPFLLAAALAAPALGFVASGVSAQTGNAAPTPDSCDHDHGPRGHGPGRGHGNPTEHAEHRARMLTAILDLDAHQQTEVRRILLRAATEMQTLMQGEHNDAQRTAMRAIHDRAKAEIDAFLNPTQRATMDRMEAARGDHHGRGHDGGPRDGQRPGRGARVGR